MKAAWTGILCVRKGFDFVPILFLSWAIELHNSFEDFCRKMCCKCCFRNVTKHATNKNNKTTSSWNPLKGHPALELFLDKVESDYFPFYLVKLSGMISSGINGKQGVI